MATKIKTYIISYGERYPQSTFYINIKATTRKQALRKFEKEFIYEPSYIALKYDSEYMAGFVNRKLIPRHTENAKFTANW